MTWNVLPTLYSGKMKDESNNEYLMIGTRCNRLSLRLSYIDVDI